MTSPVAVLRRQVDELPCRDAWELERCECEDGVDVNCGGTSSHRLLSGFQRWRCAPNLWHWGLLVLHAPTHVPTCPQCT